MGEPALQEALPERRVIEVDGVRIGLVHIPGPRAGREERLSWFPGCDAVVYGHTPLPQLERRRRGVWILNPGSPIERRRAPFRSMLVVKTAPGAELDIEQVFV
jgi:predicted phosphodiesterase